VSRRNTLEVLNWTSLARDKDQLAGSYACRNEYSHFVKCTELFTNGGSIPAFDKLTCCSLQLTFR
jgi:hypothetical protein